MEARNHSDKGGAAMIDTALRAKGIGSTDIAMLLNMSPFGDAFAVYARKLGLVNEPEKDIRQRRGSYFEQGIAAWYSDNSGNPIEWFNKTIQHQTRHWQVASPDFFVLNDKAERIGGGDSKLVNWTEVHAWGDPGTDQIPDHYALQMQWLMSTTEFHWWEVAACLGDNLQIYRVNYDPEIEATLLEVAERFWNDNVLARVPPPIGHSDTAARYLKQRFPKNIQNIRRATDDEIMLMSRYKNERAVRDEAVARMKDVENELKIVIGDCDGLDDPILGKVTYKYVKEQVGPDWEAVARSLWNGIQLMVDPAIRDRLEPLEQVTSRHQHVLREGFRRMNVPRNWKTVSEEDG